MGGAVTGRGDITSAEALSKLASRLGWRGVTLAVAHLHKPTEEMAAKSASSRRSGTTTCTATSAWPSQELNRASGRRGPLSRSRCTPHPTRRPRRSRSSRPEGEQHDRLLAHQLDRAEDPDPPAIWRYLHGDSMSRTGPAAQDPRPRLERYPWPRPPKLRYLVAHQRARPRWREGQPKGAVRLYSVRPRPPRRTGRYGSPLAIQVLTTGAANTRQGYVPSAAYGALRTVALRDSRRRGLAAASGQARTRPVRPSP